MNWVDFIILLATILFALEGLRQGFLLQAINLVGFLISLISALIFYSPAAGLLIKTFHMAPIAANPIGFLIVWVITESIFFGIFGAYFKMVHTSLGSAKVNKFMGIIPAIFNGLLFISFVLLFVVSLPFSPTIKKDVFASKIGSNLVKQVSIIENPLSEVFGPITKEGLTFLTVKPEEKEGIDLKFTQNKLSADYAQEQAMLSLVNGERAKVGVKPLAWDESRAKVARAHSEDMFKRGYFSHYSPEGKDVGDRLMEAGIPYTIAGENLALAPTLERAHDGLMNSPGHRRNILDPAFAKVGIGIIDGGVYGKMFTQVFTD